MRNPSKKQFLEGFVSIVLILALVRCAYPSVILSRTSASRNNSKDSLMVALDSSITSYALPSSDKAAGYVPFFDAQGKPVKHRIYSVSSFKKAFSDLNDVQLSAAQKNGVKPVANRKEAELKKSGLVYVGSNPFFYVDRLKSSIPYLVPRANNLLESIAKTFLDSLQIKQIPLNIIIVTSVMRTREDVQKLRKRNQNATENSCHCYGTTFDISYSRYRTVQDPDGPARHKVRNDSLKWVLSEVLNDYRKANRCYVKHEVHQGCFHVTVR